MMSDVPGFAWSLVPALTTSGVKYFSSGPNYLGKTNPYLGDRVGNFVKTGETNLYGGSLHPEKKNIILDSRKRLFIMARHSSRNGIRDWPEKIAEYLDDLTRTNYPYDIVQWRYNIVSDNGPIDPSISKFVDDWNKNILLQKLY